MKVSLKTIYVSLLLSVGFLFLGSHNLAAAEVTDGKPNAGYDFRIISSGETQYISVVTGGVLSLNDVHVLNAIVLGSGELGIGMEKSDRGGELIMMTGVAISLTGGASNFFKAGFTPNALSVAIEIGDENTPNGFLFLMTAVLPSLGKVGEGEYSIELAF